MSQAVWTGSITFGLVTIPVRLYPATEPKDVRFHLYDRRTGKRVRYERVTRADDAATFAPQSDDSDADLPTVAEATSMTDDRIDSERFAPSQPRAYAVESMIW